MPRRADKPLSAKRVETLTYLKLLAEKRPPQPNPPFVECFDAASPGMCLRVTARGVRSYIVSARVNGKQKRVTLGRATGPDAITLAKARSLAGDVKDRAARGIEPLHPDMLGRSTARPAAVTFGDVARAFIERELKATNPDGSPRIKRGWEIDEIVSRRLVPAWGGWAWDALRRRDAVELFDALVDEGKPAAANKLHEIVRRLGRWAAQRDMVDANPFADLAAPAPRVMRDRVLSHDEIRTCWKAWNRMAYPGGAFMQLALLTAQRLSEVAGITREEIDLDAKAWTIPGARTKNGAPMTVPLSAPALVVIEALPRFEGEYVLTTTAGKRPISGFSKIKGRSDDLSGVTGWTIHDLRRTARTLLAEIGTPQEIAERCLNHVPRNRLAQIYDRHHYSEPMRIAFEKLGQHVAEIVGPGKAGKVVAIGAGKERVA